MQDESVTSEKTNSILTLLMESLLRSKWQILASLMSVFTVAYCYLQFQEPLYRAVTTLRVELKKHEPIDDLMIFDGGIESWGYFNTQIALLRSRELIKRAAEQVNWGRYADVYPGHTESDTWQAMTDIQRQASIQSILRGLRIEHVPGTQLIRLYMLANHPDLARELVDLLARAYIRSDLEPQELALHRALQWYDSRLAKAQAQLEEAEQALIQFLESLGVSNYEDGREDLQEAMQDYRQQLRTHQLELVDLALTYDAIVAAESRVSALEKIPKLLDVPGVRNARKTVLSAMKAARKTGQLHDAVDSSKAGGKISLAQQAYEQELVQAANFFEAQYRFARQKEHELQRVVNSTQASLSKLDRQKSQWIRLFSDVQAYRHVYQDLLNRYRQMQVAGDFLQHKAQIVESAVSPAGPHLPDRRKVLLSSLFFGLLLALAVLYGRHLYDAHVRQA